MKDIYKVKLPGKPVKLYTAKSLKEAMPTVFETVYRWPLGTKKLLRPRKTLRLGVHKLHPRDMSPRARSKVCGPGLSGEARRLFIEEGLTFDEQRQRGQLQAIEHTARIVEEYKAAHPEEYAARDRRRALRAEARKDERAKKTGRKRIDYTKLYSPTQIAEVLGVEPLEVRKFLRAKGVGKRGGRYAFKKSEAQKIIRAFRRQS